MRVKRVILAFWLPLAILVSWQVFASEGVLDPLFFPPPTTLVAAVKVLVENGELGENLRATLTRMSMGFAVGSMCGLLCGVLMGAVAVIRRSLEPVISGLYSTPKLSLLPMLMLLMGVGEPARILLVSTGCFIMVAMHGLDAVRGISRAYVELAANYGARRLKMFRSVYLPASLPHVFTGFRLALGRALTITIALELVSCPDGIGSMIWMAWQTFSIEKLYIGVIIAGTMGAILHNSLRRLEARLIPWRS